MPRILIDLKKQTPEFRKGFLSALDFLDGADFGIQHEETPEDQSWTTIQSDDKRDDNGDRSYKFRKQKSFNKVVFDQIGAVL